MQLKRSHIVVLLVLAICLAAVEAGHGRKMRKLKKRGLAQGEGPADVIDIEQDEPEEEPMSGQRFSDPECPTAPEIHGRILNWIATVKPASPNQAQCAKNAGRSFDAIVDALRSSPITINFRPSKVILDSMADGYFHSMYTLPQCQKLFSKVFYNPSIIGELMQGYMTTMWNRKIGELLEEDAEEIPSKPSPAQMEKMFKESQCMSHQTPTYLMVRDTSERDMLDIKTDPDPKHACERPIYGALNVFNFPTGAAGPEAADSCSQDYGSCALFLKDQVKERTTLYVGDSLNDFKTNFNRESMVSFGSFDDLCPVVGGLTAQDVDNILNQKPDRLAGKMEGYIETQIWGTLKLDRDVDRVVCANDVNIAQIQAALPGITVEQA